MMQDPDAFIPHEREKNIIKQWMSHFFADGMMYSGAPIKVDGHTVGVFCAFSLPPDISERISKNQMNCLHDAADEVAAVFIDHREKYLSSAHRAQTASEPSNGSTEIRPVQMVVDGAAHDDGSSA